MARGPRADGSAPPRQRRIPQVGRQVRRRDAGAVPSQHPRRRGPPPPRRLPRRLGDPIRPRPVRARACSPTGRQLAAQRRRRTLLAPGCAVSWLTLVLALVGRPRRAVRAVVVRPAARRRSSSTSASRPCCGLSAAPPSSAGPGSPPRASPRPRRPGSRASRPGCRRGRPRSRAAAHPGRALRGPAAGHRDQPRPRPAPARRGARCPSRRPPTSARPPLRARPPRVLDLTKPGEWTATLEGDDAGRPDRRRAGSGRHPRPPAQRQRLVTSAYPHDSGAVAQSGSAPRSHRGGQGFESPQLHQSETRTRTRRTTVLVREARRLTSRFTAVAIDSAWRPSSVLRRRPGIVRTPAARTACRGPSRPPAVRTGSCPRRRGPHACHARGAPAPVGIARRTRRPTPPELPRAARPR